MHRAEILKRVGSNIEEMTRRALIERPEDPRTEQLRRELESERLLNSERLHARESEIEKLNDELKVLRIEAQRTSAGMKDVVELQNEIQLLREQIQMREKELMAEREKCDNMQKQQALARQTMLARLAQLESPSIGSSETIETNQTREAKLVKLPSWMRIGK